jgi:dTDP-4-amino-4,6-dideoxy-D-galactose acyltransferase
MKIKHLDWDSSFFNKKIGLLDLSNDYKFSEIQNDYDLIYVISDKEISVDIPNFKQTYSENKIVFSKKIAQNREAADANIFSELNSLPKKEIYDLAFESGKFSRFNLDLNFKNSEFQKLYEKWVDNSYTKEFADNVLVYNYKNKSVGFVTYKVFGNYAKVGLIATNPQYQGKGTGRKMLEAVEKELFAVGVAELRIPTQLQNEIACLFYTKMGYEIIENKILKHYWKL